MPILDGAKPASELPPLTVALLNEYGDRLAAEAVQRQQRDGLAIQDMLALVVSTDDGDTVGVARTDDVLPELLDVLSLPERQRLHSFLGRQLPPTHLRLVCWSEAGLAMMRVDTVPMRETGGRAS